MRRIWWTFVSIVVVFLAALYVDLPKVTKVLGQPARINKGIDLAGGARLLMCPDKGQRVTSSEVDIARNVIQNRASGAYGVAEPQVSIVNNNCISVELPGVANQQAAINA